MKKIFLWGAPTTVIKTEGESTTSLLDRTGKNTGNLLIGYSVASQLSADYATMSQMTEPKQIEEECSCIVIAAANFLYSGFDFGFMADFVEKVQLPCTIIGLGAQSNEYNVTKIKIPDGTLRLIKIISERSAALGVRGYYTAQVLASYGIHNVEVIGCPSFYLNGNPELKIHKKSFSEVKKISINGSRRVIRHSLSPENMRIAEMGLLNDAMKYDCDFIVQDEHEEAMLARKQLEEIQDSLFHPIVSYYKDLPADKVKSFFEARSKVFFDVPTWSSHIKQYDFVCGTRFHGNLIALQNGVPATVIAHDSRTRELSELLAIPNISIQEIESMDNINLEKIYNNADFDRLSKAYSYLYQRYLAFLKANNLKHKLPNLHEEKTFSNIPVAV
jgi:hypothetical protein